MKIKFEEVKEFVELQGYTSRRDRYRGARDFFAIKHGIVLDEDVYKAFDTFHRYFRDNEIFPKDAVGEKLEKEWRMPDYLRTMKNNQIAINF